MHRLQAILSTKGGRKAMFPRGGSLKLTPAPAAGSAKTKGKKGEVSRAASNENVLFKVAKPAPKHKAQKKRRASDGPENEVEEDPVFASLQRQTKLRRGRGANDDSDDEDMLAGMTRPKFVHRLSRSKLEPGTLTLAVVTKVTATVAQVSLPCNINAILRVENFSDEHASGVEDAVMDLTQGLVSVGDMLFCAILGVVENENGKGNTVEVSTAASLVNRRQALEAMKPGMVLHGSVRSVEDHGYHINVGRTSIANGFLRYADAGDSLDEPKLKVGQCIKTVIKTVAAGKGRMVFQLELNEAKAELAKLKSSLSFDSLQPGMRVKCQISSYLREGMCVFFLDSFYGTIDAFHGKTPEIDYAAKMGPVASKGFTIDARVLFVDFADKRVALSCADHINNRSEESKKNDANIMEKQVGRVLSDVVVRRVDPTAGVLLETSDGLYAYAWRSRFVREEAAGSDEIVQLDKRFKVGQKTRCKVLAYSAADGVLNVSLSKSVIEATILLHDELKEGQKVNGKVFKVADFGILVSLSDNVRAIVPQQHLAEVLISDPSKRFKVGQTVSARVLSLNFDDATKPKVVLTLKRSLVGTSLPLVTCNEDAKPGMLAQGFVTKVDADRGVYVSFFGSAFGQVSLQELASTGIQNPAEAYPVGKVVKVKVLRNSSRCMKLSFRTLASEDANETGLVEGEIVAGKVQTFAKSEAHVRIEVKGDDDDDEDADESSKKAKKKQKKNKKKRGALAALPMTHLSDEGDETKLAALYKSLRSSGTAVQRLMVLKKGDDGSPLVTRKPALILAQRRGWLPSSLENVQAGMTVVGYVQNVTNIGVFVNFLGSLVGLVPRANVADDFVNDPKDFVNVGQTVCCVVLSVDEAKGHMTLSMKQSAVEYPTDLLMALLDERQSEASQLHPCPELSLAKIGDVVEAEVQDVTSFGVEVTLDGSGAAGLCMNEHVPNKSDIQAGDKVECRVLDVNFAHSRYDLSLRPSLIDPVKKGNGATAQSKLVKAFQSGIALRASVELVQDAGRYAILSVADAGAHLVKAPLQGLSRKRLSDLPPGLLMDSTCEMRLARTLQDEAPGLALGRILPPALPGRGRSRSRASSIDEGSLRSGKVTLEIGALVQGKVTNMAAQYMQVALHNAQLPENSPHAGKRLNGQVHVSNALGRAALQQAAAQRQGAFHDYSVGDFVQAVVIDLESKTDARGQEIVNVWLSLAAEQDGVDDSRALDFENIKTGEVHPCYVAKIHDDGVIVSLSRKLRGYIFCAQLSRDIDFLDSVFNDDQQEPDQVLKPSAVLMARVLSVDVQRKRCYGPVLVRQLANADLEMVDINIDHSKSRIGAHTPGKGGQRHFPGTLSHLAHALSMCVAAQDEHGPYIIKDMLRGQWGQYIFSSAEGIVWTHVYQLLKLLRNVNQATVLANQSHRGADQGALQSQCEQARDRIDHVQARVASIKGDLDRQELFGASQGLDEGSFGAAAASRGAGADNGTDEESGLLQTTMQSVTSSAGLLNDVSH
ncbi:Protein RRP5-like [Hondaea fermentalgiana]|uniref:Protein RRP5-like n=1 Tax=Hondaea fermentalgiana TaxID=2315210 RepID=A0A2R5GQ86_9STRA|nr:Protein RRP5-like [Hondaea fermentalgiana]|eukprot:GBG30044.1 Protein RRP5-like [Hondaea fermentalgiana]